jgi:Putative Actinobacterial Holin-X, holin superfamily III
MTDFAGQAPPQRQYRDVPETDAETNAETKSIGEALGDVTRDLSVLFQQEVALAKAEVRQTVNKAGQAAGMFAGAAMAAFLFVLFLSVALWEALSESTGRGWGAVIVAAIWLVAGLVLFAVARAQMKKVSGLPQTTETVRQVPNALKGQEERNQ